ncbi:MAG: hypothetical protein FWE22_04760 [Firmicutes bacterium]|nr:hypothetical protein [Bacillota bacterium]
MNETIEVVAKDVAQAIELGMARLSANISEVEVKVLSHGGFFKSAKILIAKGKITDPGEQIKTAGTTSSHPQTKNKEQKPAATNVQQKPAGTVMDRPNNKNEQHPQQKHAGAVSDRPNNKPEQRSEPRQGQKPTGADALVRANNRPEPRTQQHQSQKQSPITPHSAPHTPHSNPQLSTTNNHSPKQKPKASPEQAKKVADYIQGLITKMGIEGEVAFEIREDVEIEIKTQDASAIGYKGETLGALELLANAFSGDDASVIIDSLGYRQKRINILKSVADKTAEKALRIGKKVFLEPMDNRERKIIHAYLENHPRVISKSEGNDANRRVVIIPKK